MMSVDDVVNDAEKAARDVLEKVEGK